jgi:hypothetical protein
MRTSTIRPPRVVGAAAVGFALCFGLLAAADPAWAGVVGVDVWNVERLQTEIQSSDQFRHRLDKQLDQMDRAFAINLLLAQELAAGQRSLDDAIDVYAATNREVHGTTTMLEATYPQGCERSRVARHLIFRAEYQVRADSATLQRLADEYSALFPNEPQP